MPVSRGVLSSFEHQMETHLLLVYSRGVELIRIRSSFLVEVLPVKRKGEMRGGIAMSCAGIRLKISIV
jgi:hypothetical protein